MRTAAVIGLGRAGAGYDKFVSGMPPRSHVGALLACGFSIAAVVDPSEAARRAALEAWPQQLVDTWSVSDIDSLPKGVAEVVILSTPPDDRLEQVRRLMVLSPRVLIVEKPLALDATTASHIVSLASKSDVDLRVNFHRRFDENHVAMRSRIDVHPARVVMSYGKGLFNYASHLVDLAIDWFGGIAAVQGIGSASDENPSFWCRMDRGFDLFVLGIDNLEYDQFDIDIFLPKAKMTLHLGGCVRALQLPVDGRFYPGYVHLGEAVVMGKRGPIGGLVEMYQQISEFLDGGGYLSGCTIAEAAHGIAVLEAVAASRTEGRPMAPSIGLHHHQRGSS